ncbi:YggT family protein [Chloroflexota bacterium]
MGRPWWYDSYWEKNAKPQRRGFRIPRGPLWVWSAILLLSLLLTIVNGSFHISVASWVLGFIYHLCRILVFVIFVRALLSWITVIRSNLLVVLLDEICNPILRPLRRIVPRLGMFDITPMVAILILYIIPWIISAVLF